MVPHLELHLPSKPRKLACLACRRRKKRCDSNRPACSACIRWGVECVYASDSNTHWTTDSPSREHFSSLPSEANHGVSGLESNSPLLMVDQLPSAEHTIQLTGEFFALSTPLEWAILATAAKAHRNVTVSSRADMFLQTAIDSLVQSPLLRDNVSWDLQAAVWCVYSLYYSGEITKAIMLLAQAYSLSCLNGLNRLDDPDPNAPITMRFSPIEVEECLGTLWALFVLDRQINYLVGRHFVIDDMQWCVNYPLDDASLQKQSGLRLDPESERYYNRDLAAWAWEEPNISISIALSRLVCKASAMIGRFITYKSINPMPSDTDAAQKRQADFHELHVWLVITLHTCSTLLCYITDAERRSPGSNQYPTEYENSICTYESVNKVWRRSQQQEYRLDLGLMLRLLERVADKQEVMTRIYKEIIEQELGRDLSAQGGGNLGQALVRTQYCFMI
ncbi:hypothetical protein BDW71DRAFT_196032 [Aspergillus fruticulosus]